MKWCKSWKSKTGVGKNDGSGDKGACENTAQRLEPWTNDTKINKDITETVPSWLLTTRAYSSLGCPGRQNDYGL